MVRFCLRVRLGVFGLLYIIFFSGFFKVELFFGLENGWYVCCMKILNLHPQRQQQPTNGLLCRMRNVEEEI